MHKYYKSIILTIQKLISNSPTIQKLFWGYFACTLVGWLILLLPLCQRYFVSGLDALFSVISAISTTGLATVDIGKAFTFPGQLTLLLLIQLGGLGYMVFSSFIVLNIEQNASDLSEHNSIDKALVSGLIKRACAYTLFCETAGFIALYAFFYIAGVENALWNALFHSVSAFCTAGFSLFTSNLELFKSHTGINITLSILSLLGAFGFFLGIDCFKKMTRQKKTINFTLRIVQSFITILLLIGSLAFFLAVHFSREEHQLIISFFQITSAVSTSGFNTIDIKILPKSALALLMMLMLCGVSLTARIRYSKSTAFVSLLKMMFKLLSRKTKNRMWHFKLLLRKTQLATSIMMHFLFVLLISFLVLLSIEDEPFLPLLFETTSALCTVGLSMGITQELSLLGKSIIMLLMWMGRIGIVIFGFATYSRSLSWVRVRQESAV